MKRIIFLLFSIILFIGLSAENTVKNMVYAKRDTCNLTMDVYTPLDIKSSRPCLVFVFGGGFKTGSKNNIFNVNFLKAMADSGFVVAAIDYRLGMKGIKLKKSNKVQTITRAINMAVEDLFSATGFLLNHTRELKIDSSKIILCGSSAGAITVLQADFDLTNRSQIASGIPLNFHYAGVIAFAGGILSYNGAPKYNKPPSPTMFFHGTKDKLVPYNQIKLLHIGFYGTNALVKQFEKKNYPYFAYRYRDIGHEIAAVPMKYNLSDINMFIREYVFCNQKLKKDISVKNPDLKPLFFGNWKLKDLYK